MSAAENFLSEVLEAFDFGAPVVGAMRFGCGHINDTFCVHTQPADEDCRTFILQRMSAAAFKHPDELMENIIKIRDQFQIAVMLIEHDMNLVMGICEGICVLNYGRIIAKGTAEEIQSNPVVIEAYLGSQHNGENKGGDA